MMQLSKKLSTVWLTIVMSLIGTITVFAEGESADVGAKIDSWGNTFVSILTKLVRFGGIISLICLGLFLYFNNDEQGAKHGKKAFVIILVATFIAWFAPMIFDQFAKTK